MDLFEKKLVKGEPPTEGLTFAEKKTAYGFSSKPVNGKTDQWILKMKALSDREITVSKDEKGAWVARTRIGSEQNAVLRAVHVEMKKQVIPAVKHIEIFGARGAHELKRA